MSVVIIGGNECMVREYKDLCEEYSFKAKVFPKMSKTMRNVGCPDLVVLFTNTISHKMVHSILSSTKGKEVKIARSHTSSLAALKSILEETKSN